jgi:hypothetical protein
MTNTRLWTCATQGFVRAAACARGFFACRRGSVAITIGVSISVLIGMVGLGTEITFVMYKQRQMQSAADSAAHGAATALSKGNPVNYALEAKAIAATGGFVDGAGGVVVTVNKPPASGNNTANADAVEVIVTQPQTLQLVSLFSDAAFNVGARAVAVKGTTGNFCVLTTDTSSTTGITINNGARVTLDSCGVAANGTGSSALTVSGGARLETQSVSVSGGVKVNNGGQITSEEPIEESQPAKADPYAAINAPAPAGCAWTNKAYNWHPVTPQQVMPGTFCGGLSVGGGTTVNFNPGVYYIKSGTLTFGGGAKITGTGVTFVLTNNSNSNYATVNIGNGTDVTLSAPTSGLTSGIVFFGDRAAPSGKSNTFGGGAKMELTGAVYSPTRRVVYDNGASNSATCLQLIAWRVRFMGGSRFNNDCDSAGTSPITGGTATTLVE